MAVNAGALPQHAHGVAEILREHVQHGHPSLLAMHFTEQVRPAEPEQRLTPRLGRRQAVPAAFVDQQLEMRGQLFVELAVQPLVPRPPPTAATTIDAQPAASSVGPPSLARTRPITAASRSQFSVSATSCFSPALVML